MKLRIEDNTLRLRLSEEEVQQFGEKGRVSVTVKLGPKPSDQLVYTLEHSPNPEATALKVVYAVGALDVQVPRQLATEWVSTDRLGFSDTIPVTADQQLRVLVEKDLDCKH
ncbi:DUF7009 family protein [Hymenobacter crusticola]|uniref:Uncharacterized protein n=1 Tax=Hymenobacter crusticola TaxID=1770526 RepID=A0A243WLK8_9BACT|nr:hypothetical protein [Hymenobacter crusticola]OUJ76177.1 hypothetical protein BXP70_02600 [Hymenobacter crusticola]